MPQRRYTKMMIKNGAAHIVVRKLLHILIALAPAFASLNYSACVLFLCAGTVFYGFVESCRFEAYSPRWMPLAPIISVICFASHRRDKTRFVLGPLTLGAGALCVLIFFDAQAAAMGIYALAAGDSAAGLAGRLLGRLRPRILHGKSVEGSAACCAVICAVVLLAGGNFSTALVCGAAGTLAEALPIEDFDNVLLPFTVACAATLMR